MKCSAPKVCATLAIVISWIVLVRLFTSKSTSDEVVLPPLGNTRPPNIVGEIVLSILTRNSQISEEKKLKVMGSRNASEVIDPDIFTVYIQPKDVTFQKTQKRKLSILIIVTTLPKSISRRMDIRSTWMKWAKESNDKYFVRVFFFLGLSKSSSIFDIQELLNENAIHNDLIVDDFSEHYFRLTPKTLRLLKWYTQTYGEDGPDFLVKTDHDVFINVPNLNSYLLSVISNSSDSATISSQHTNTTGMSKSESKEVLNSPSAMDLSSSESLNLKSLPPWYFIGGDVYAQPVIETDPFSKFFVNTTFWFGRNISKFPSYAGGPLYILSGNIIPHLYNGALSVPLFYFEDAYLLGLVGHQHLHLNLTNTPGVYTTFQKSMRVIRNKYKMRRMMSIHPVEPPVQMYNIFNILTKNKTNF